MLSKLLALAERGIDGEKIAAQRKIRRLKARFDFEAPDPSQTPDLFRGAFKPSRKAKRIFSFTPSEFDLANQVKWAIETRTGIRCVYRNSDLLAEATQSAANQLAEIAVQISGRFRALVAQFGGLKGVSAADRGVFVMGLYDGMMNELRDMGQPLPSRPAAKTARRTKKPVASTVTGLHVHPYTLGVGLGRQIRFSVPLQELAAELDRLTRPQLSDSAAPPDGQPGP